MASSVSVPAVADTESAQPATTATGPGSSQTTPDTAGSSARALLRPVVDLVRAQSHELHRSLRVQRDVFVEGWAGRFDDLAQQVAEDKRQARAHIRRAEHALHDRLQRLRKRRHAASAPAFPQFARLPAEIRLQIWHEALPGPRAVVLRSPYTFLEAARADLATIVPPPLRRRSSTTPPADLNSRHWTSPTAPPAMLHACSESRAVALTRYRPVLAVPADDASAALPPIYADLDHDVICISGREAAPRCAPLWARTADLSNIRHLAVAACPWAVWSSTHGTTSSFAHSLPPRDLLRARFLALEDVAVVRSVRWQYGRLPSGAVRDYEAWSVREERDEGISRWYTKWRDGVMVIRDGSRKSLEHGDQQQDQPQQQEQQ